MKNDPKKKRLTLEEGAALLGAEGPERVDHVRLDPISMRAIATRIGRRLTSSGGRPTDASWEISRKVPMKMRTWQRLNELARSLGKQNVRVAPGQLAAIALEKGLISLFQEYEQKTESLHKVGEPGPPEYDIESQDCKRPAAKRPRRRSGKS